MKKSTLKKILAILSLPFVFIITFAVCGINTGSPYPTRTNTIALSDSGFPGTNLNVIVDCYLLVTNAGSVTHVIVLDSDAQSNFIDFGSIDPGKYSTRFYGTVVPCYFRCGVHTNERMTIRSQ